MFYMTKFNTGEFALVKAFNTDLSLDSQDLK